MYSSSSIALAEVTQREHPKLLDNTNPFLCMASKNSQRYSLNFPENFSVEKEQSECKKIREDCENFNAYDRVGIVDSNQSSCCSFRVSTINSASLMDVLVVKIDITPILQD